MVESTHMIPAAYSMHPHHAGPTRIFSDDHLRALSERFPRMIPSVRGGEKLFGVAMTLTEVMVSAAAMTYANARADARTGKAGDGLRILGAPVDIAAGLAVIAVSTFGYFGAHGDHATNFGIGLLCAYGCRKARAWGSDAAQSPMQVTGAPPPVMEGSPTPSQWSWYPGPQNRSSQSQQSSYPLG